VLSSVTNETSQLAQHVPYMFPLDANFALADKVAHIFVQTDPLSQSTHGHSS